MDGLTMKYFVLSPNKAGPYGYASRVALAAYAKAIKETNKVLANDLNTWLIKGERIWNDHSLD